MAISVSFSFGRLHLVVKLELHIPKAGRKHNRYSFNSLILDKIQVTEQWVVYAILKVLQEQISHSFVGCFCVEYESSLPCLIQLFLATSKCLLFVNAEDS